MAVLVRVVIVFGVTYMPGELPPPTVCALLVNTRYWLNGITPAGVVAVVDAQATLEYDAAVVNAAPDPTPDPGPGEVDQVVENVTNETGRVAPADSPPWPAPMTLN